MSFIRKSIPNFYREAEIIVKIYTKFLAAGEIDISEIGILTPYLAQRNLLKKAMEIARDVNIYFF